MIRLQGVTVSATGPAGEGRPLLDCADLSIRSGEYLGVTGPNGAGKSLLLRVLAGLQAPSSGTVLCVKADIRVALVFQSPDDQIVGSTVERDLAFGLENHGVPSPEIRRRVDEALEWSGLAPMARQPPHLLSEGEKQRLALASALILRPNASSASVRSRAMCSRAITPRAITASARASPHEQAAATSARASSAR
jgi:energy-coupling factor transporter ATP-binding protein EcfA2